MEILFEILFGLFVELPLEIAMESKRLKNWIKTTLFLILANVITFLMVWAMIDVWQEQSGVLELILWCVIAIGWVALTAYGAIIGHAKHWKQN